MFQQPLKLTHIGKNLTTQACPTDLARRFSALTAHMNDVILYFLRTELLIPFCLISPNRVCGFKIETSLKQTFEHINPWVIFTVMKCESQDSTRFHYSMSLSPSTRQ